MTDPANVKIDTEKALKWLKTGAQPSDTAKSLLTQLGIWEQFVNPGAASTIEEDASKELPVATEPATADETEEE